MAAKRAKLQHERTNDPMICELVTLQGQHTREEVEREARVDRILEKMAEVKAKEGVIAGIQQRFGADRELNAMIDDLVMHSYRY